MHPEQACIALRAHEHREAFFPLDADFALRVTLQQPKLLCSSHLGETCPTPPDAVGGVLVGWNASLPFTDANTPQAVQEGGLRRLRSWNDEAFADDVGNTRTLS